MPGSAKGPAPAAAPESFYNPEMPCPHRADMAFLLLPSALLSVMTQKIVLASNNQGKLREFGALLGAIGLDVRPQGEFDVPEADEPFATFVENALTKARHAARLTGLPALADDSGVCVNALGGAPG